MSSLKRSHSAPNIPSPTKTSSSSSSLKRCRSTYLDSSLLSSNSGSSTPFSSSLPLSFSLSDEDADDPYALPPGCQFIPRISPEKKLLKKLPISTSTPATTKYKSKKNDNSTGKSKSRSNSDDNSNTIFSPNEKFQGQSRETLDEYNYLFDGIQHTHPLSVRYSSLLSLITLFSEPQAFRLLCLNSVFQNIFPTLLSYSKKDSIFQLGLLICAYLAAEEKNNCRFLGEQGVHFLLMLVTGKQTIDIAVTTSTSPSSSSSSSSAIITPSKVMKGKPISKRQRRSSSGGSLGNINEDNSSNESSGSFSSGSPSSISGSSNDNNSSSSGSTSTAGDSFSFGGGSSGGGRNTSSIVGERDFLKVINTQKWKQFTREEISYKNIALFVLLKGAEDTQFCSLLIGLDAPRLLLPLIHADARCLCVEREQDKKEDEGNEKGGVVKVVRKEEQEKNGGEQERLKHCLSILEHLAQDLSTHKQLLAAHELKTSSSSAAPFSSPSRIPPPYPSPPPYPCPPSSPPPPARSSSSTSRNPSRSSSLPPSSPPSPLLTTLLDLLHLCNQQTKGDHEPYVSSILMLLVNLTNKSEKGCEAVCGTNSKNNKSRDGEKILSLIQVLVDLLTSTRSRYERHLSGMYDTVTTALGVLINLVETSASSRLELLSAVAREGSAVEFFVEWFVANDRAYQASVSNSKGSPEKKTNRKALSPMKAYGSNRTTSSSAASLFSDSFSFPSSSSSTTSSSSTSSSSVPPLKRASSIHTLSDNELEEESMILENQMIACYLSVLLGFLTSNLPGKRRHEVLQHLPNGNANSITGKLKEFLVVQSDASLLMDDTLEAIMGIIEALNKTD